MNFIRKFTGEGALAYRFPIRTGSIIAFVAAIVGIYLTVGFAFSVTLKPWEVGIYQAKLGMNKGFHAYDKEGNMYPGGRMYLMIPFRDAMIKIDQRLQYVDIRAERRNDGRGNLKILEGTGLVATTTDGQKVTNDVSIVWYPFVKANLPPAVAHEAAFTSTSAQNPQQPESAEEGEGTKTAEDALQEVAKAVPAEIFAADDPTIGKEEASEIGYYGGPLQLISKFGTNPAVWNDRVRKIAEDACKRALGKLKTDDYYNSTMRDSMTYLAQKMLNEGWSDENGVVHTGLHAVGIHVQDVLIRAYTYPNVIDEAIFAKVTQVQQAALNKAKEEMEKQNAEVAKVDAEGKADYDTRLIEAAAQETIIKSQADMYKKTRESEGDLLVKSAEAQVTQLKAKAMEIQGGDLYVLQQLAELPAKVTGGILTEFNPLDIKEWMEFVSPGVSHFEKLSPTGNIRDIVKPSEPVVSQPPIAVVAPQAPE